MAGRRTPGSWSRRSCCSPGWPRTSTGPAATWSGPRTPPGSCGSTPTSSSTSRCGRPVTWEPLLAVIGERSDFDARYQRADEASILKFLVADPDHPGSVLSSIGQTRENLRTTREVLPREAWAAVNDLFLYMVSNHTDGVARRSRSRFLERVIGESQRVVGILDGHHAPRRGVGLLAARHAGRAGRHDDPGARRAGRQRARRARPRRLRRRALDERAALAVGAADVPPGHRASRSPDRAPCASCCSTTASPGP